MKEVKTKWKANTNTLSQLPESALLNNDDDDKEAGFQPTSSNSAEMDSSKGTSCFENRQKGQG